MARKTDVRAARKATLPAKSPIKAAKPAKPVPAPRRRPVRRSSLLAAPPSPAEDALAIEAANRRYYDAFQSLNPEEIAKIWWHDDAAACVHPGWDVRHGWEAVRESFEEIFSNTRMIRFALGDVRVRTLGDLGYVTCIENLVSEEGDSGDYLGAVLATNLFERRHGDWKLIHHHASPFSSDEAELPEGPLH